MDTGQREVLAATIVDAVRYRMLEALCEDCETRPEGLCDECAADLDLTDAYLGARPRARNPGGPVNAPATRRACLPSCASSSRSWPT